MKSKVLLPLLPLVLLAPSPLPAATVVLSGALDTFQGSLDLDLTGDIESAVNAGLTPQTINGVPFTLTTNTPGVTVVGPGAPFAWTSYNFVLGLPTDNLALNNVMTDIQCCSGGGTHQYSFAVTPGNDYEVQVWWGENGGNQTSRNWDLALEGALMLDEVYPNGAGPPGPANPTPDTGTRWVDTITAGDASLDITLGQIGGNGFAGGDSNYVVSAFVIKDLGADSGGGGGGGAAVPEPASIAIWSLVGLALGGWGYARRGYKTDCVRSPVRIGSRPS